MDILVPIFPLIQTIVSISIILLKLVYSIPIICVRRFHHANNIFTLNICVATILCCLSWLPLDAEFLFDSSYDGLETILPCFDVAKIIFTIQLPFSCVIASIHRCCSLVYHTNIFFRRKQWIVLCIASQ
jgi:hypothetical protein